MTVKEKKEDVNGKDSILKVWRRAKKERTKYTIGNIISCSCLKE
jgi:hypothetical protein